MLIFLLGALASPFAGAQHPDAPSDTEETPLPQAFPASGALRADYFRSSRLLDDRKDFYGATAQLKFAPRIADGVTGVVEAFVSQQDIVRGGANDNFVNEAYVAVHAGAVDLRIGKQKVVWGRADSINPTDNLTPRDYTVLLPFDEDQRRGIPALKLDVGLTERYSATLFASYWFEPSKVALPLPAGAMIEKSSRPGHGVGNGQFGIKLNSSDDETDWSLSYYRGYSLLPEMRVSALVPPSTALIELRYPRISVLGADAAHNFGAYSFRGEAAYISPDDYGPGDPTSLRPTLYYVFGIDRTFAEDVNVNVQVVGSRVTRFDDGGNAAVHPAVAAIALENAVLFNQRHRSNHGFTFRVSRRWRNDTVEAELLMARYLNPANSYAVPRIVWHLTDRWKLTAGRTFYTGPADSYFGAFRKNAGFFAEMRFSF